jgi:hypothetical protein
LENTINGFIIPKSIHKEQFPALQHYRIKSIPIPKGEFLSELFNEYLEETYSSEEFIRSRYEFARSGGKIFKEQMPEKWEGSEPQKYINALLKNLNEYSPFEVKNTDWKII